MRVSPHQRGLRRQSAQPTTEHGTAVRPSQRDDIPSPALQSEGSGIADIERDWGDWPSEVVEEVGSMVRNCEQFRLSSNAHIFVAAALVWERSLTHFVVGDDSKVVGSVAFAYGVTAALGGLRSSMSSPSRTMLSPATARSKLKNLGNKQPDGNPHSRLSQHHQVPVDCHSDFPRVATPASTKQSPLEYTEPSTKIARLPKTRRADISPEASVEHRCLNLVARREGQADFVSHANSATASIRTVRTTSGIFRR